MRKTIVNSLSFRDFLSTGLIVALAFSTFFVPISQRHVDASNVANVGPPCNIDASLDTINANRDHAENGLYGAGYAVDLKSGCSDDNVIASISGNITIDSQDQSEYCVDGNGSIARR